MLFQDMITFVKGVNICFLVQILLIGLLLISEQQASQINILLGFFIPIYNHLISFKRRYNQSQHSSNIISSPTSSTFQAATTPIISSEQNNFNSFGCMYSSQTSSSSLSSSSPTSVLSSISSSVATNSSLSLQQKRKENFLKSSENEQHLNKKYLQQEEYHNNQQPNQAKYNMNENIAKNNNSNQTSTINSTFTPSNNYNNTYTNLTSLSKQQQQQKNDVYTNQQIQFTQFQQTPTTTTQQGNSNSILSYWPMYCVLIILEQQLFSKTMIARHEYQIIKCLVIFILRNYSFVIYLLIKEAFTLKGEEGSLFYTPQHIQLKNEIIMQKIDDQIKCYSRLNISLSKKPFIKTSPQLLNSSASFLRSTHL